MRSCASLDHRMKTVSIILLMTSFLALHFDLNAQKLNERESAILNQHFNEEREDFNFTEKQVCFFLAGSTWKKNDFFSDLNLRNANNQSMSNQLIILSEEQKEKSGGYDVFIYSWSKVLITEKRVESDIEKIKKRATTTPPM